MNKKAFKACFLLTTLQRNINKQQEHTTINNKIRKKKARRKKEEGSKSTIPRRRGERRERLWTREETLLSFSLCVIFEAYKFGI